MLICLFERQVKKNELDDNLI